MQEKTGTLTDLIGDGLRLHFRLIRACCLLSYFQPAESSGSDSGKSIEQTVGFLRFWEETERKSEVDERFSTES